MNGKRMHDTAMMDAVPGAEPVPEAGEVRPSVVAAVGALGLAVWLAAWAATRAWLRMWWREPAAMGATLGAGMLLSVFVARCSIPVQAETTYADTDVAGIVQDTCESQYPGRGRAQTINGRWACVDSTTGEVLLWWYGDSPGATATPAATAAAVGGTALPVWLPETVTRWAPEITAAATRYGVDPALVAIVTTVESCGLRTAVSPAGALGLMQVVPKYHPRILQGDPNDAAHNLDVGTAFLADLLRATGGDVTRAVCQYNGGGNCAALAESQRYMRWVGGMWAERDQPTSATYDAWLAAVQATPNNLCQRAAAEARS